MLRIRSEKISGRDLLGLLPGDYGYVSRYVLRQWKTLVWLVVLCFLVSGLAVLQPWPLKFLVDTISGSGKPPPWLGFLGLSGADFQRDTPILVIAAAVASFVAYSTSTLMDMALGYGWTKMGQRMVYELAADLYEKLQARSLSLHDERPVGDSLNRLFGDSWSLYTIAYTLVTVPLQHIVTIAIITIVAWHTDPILTLIAIGVVPIATVFSYMLAQWLGRLARDEARLTSDIMAFVQQTLSVIPLIQSFSAFAHTRRIYRAMTERGVDIAGRTALVNQGVLIVSNLTVAATSSAVLLIGGLRILSGHITLGVLVVFLAYLKTIHVSVEACLTAMAKVMPAHVGLRRVCEILEEGSAIVEPPNAVLYSKPQSGRAGRIKFELVCFGYGNGQPVLNRVDLEIEPGETVAIVGPSGGGKSTLVSLIPRFFDPDSGRVLIDGQDVRSLALSSLRSQISVVLQDPFLLPMSVAENISYDPKGHSRDQTVAAAVATGAHDFICGLPNGYDTILGEYGAMLSGGQKQLIAISRALLKDAPILILDEPTSALDAGTEAEVLSGLRRLIANRTTIIVAHRLSTIRSADRILLVQNGEVRELAALSEIDGSLRQAVGQ